ncbi:5-formyltetrahydrofolate cyclo-ligase [Croceitalea rosinachiae]|uniref:5-formyltetrahydrofolate cyclo-ligase n=1 Tax=Croceitalea rosinachiae TaxID=3075596 RepID=A0ABU3AAE1_9FLAO|nr:5-formyltetrahydrofolate cyclo-ligase [Croceitalea sp. F388]MDT0606512.1 5-formyltetrahydrofolate cyclo-ligase [Croceitalea sp. F388]
MLKKELRLHYKSKRALLNSDTIANQSLEISNRMLSLPIWNFSFYHTFLSIKENQEVDSSPLITILQGKDKNIVVPKTISANRLENYLLTDSTLLKPNKLNIPEPVDGIKIEDNKIDVVFIPLLAYDKNGNRVGYGKGYYDSFLAKCRKDVTRVGLSFFEPEEEIKDVGEHDIPLDYCVAPDNIYKF